MSYILKALKKSQQERELGQVPTLAAEPYASHQQSTKTSPWVLSSFVLAVVAVLIAAYAAFEQRIAPTQHGDPPELGESLLHQGDGSAEISVSSSPQAPAVAESAADVQAKLTPESDPRRSKDVIDRASRVQPAVSVESAASDTAEVEAQPPSQIQQDLEPAQTQHERDGSRADVQEALSTSTGPQDPPIPSDLRQEIQEFKRKALQEEYGVAPDDAMPEVDAKSSPLPQPVPDIPSESDIKHTPTKHYSSPAPGPNQPLPENMLPDNILERLPERKITVRVYSENPEKRFVVLNFAKMKEGDRTREGLVVEEIQKERVVLGFEGYKFFDSR